MGIYEHLDQYSASRNFFPTSLLRARSEGFASPLSKVSPRALSAWRSMPASKKPSV